MMTIPLKNTDHWFKEETRGQRWRRLTPLAVLTNLLTTFMGLGLAVYFGNYYIQTQDKKFDLDNQRINTVIQDQENDRTKYWQQFQGLSSKIDCTKVALASCCGDKAHLENCT